MYGLWKLQLLGLLLAMGCASPCSLSEGSCLELIVDSSLVHASLQIELLSGSPAAERRLAIGHLEAEEIAFPALLKVIPPANHSSAEVGGLSISAIVDKRVAQTGEIHFSWPQDSHMSRELVLAEVAVPMPAPMPPTPPEILPWPHRRIEQDFPGDPIGILAPMRLAGDDKDSLLATSLGSSTLNTLKSSGDGHFSIVAAVPVPGPPSAVVAQDLTADGNPEAVVVARSIGAVYLFPGLPSGKLGAPKELIQRADFDLLSPMLTDANSDGMMDLLIANHDLKGLNGGYLVQFLGQKVDGAPLSSAVLSMSGGNRPLALTPAVFGVAGSPKQIVVTHEQSSRAVILWNSLKAIETAPTPESRPLAVAAGDMDSDGIVDLAILYGRGSQSSLLRVLRGQSSGTFTPLRELELPTGPRGLWAVDLARDGAVDLVAVCDGEPTRLQVLSGTPTSDSSVFPIELGETIGDPVSLDVNGDHWRDLVVPVQRPSRILSLLGQPRQ